MLIFPSLNFTSDVTCSPVKGEAGRSRGQHSGIEGSEQLSPQRLCGACENAHYLCVFRPVALLLGPRSFDSSPNYWSPL